MNNPSNPSSKLLARIILLLVFAAAVYFWYALNISSNAPVDSQSVPVSTNNDRPITPTVTNNSASNSSNSVGNSSASSSAKFDFYVLVLSWSPDFCADTGDQDQQQCAIGRKLGFVLHGLWPQYDQGYPSDCSSVRLTQDIKSKYAGLFPSTSLYDHEWEKHGTCTGLTSELYLSLAKRLKDSVNIPAAYRSPEQPFRTTAAQMKKDFVATNPQQSESSFCPFCSGSGRFLQELYICYSPDGKTVACSNEIQRDSSKSCGGPDFLVRNVR